MGVCVAVGFIVGFPWCFISGNWYDWPTREMESRGEFRGLASGAFVAAASGVGVALSVLGDYTSTVIGVAISASLLPPAVNSGMLLAFALYELTSVGNRHSKHRFEPRELVGMAFTSFLLTILNIFILFLTAGAMFKIKDVVQTQDRNQERLWDNISHFKQQHKKLKGTKTMRSSDSIVEDEPFPFAKSNIDAINLDVHAKDGTNAAKAIQQIENTMTHEDMLGFYAANTAKVGVMRQVSNFYSRKEIVNVIRDEKKAKQRKVQKKKNTKYKGGYGNIANELSSDNESSSDNHEAVTIGHSRPALSTIFANEETKAGTSVTSRTGLLHQKSNDNVVSNSVLDENDQH